MIHYYDQAIVWESQNFQAREVLFVDKTHSPFLEKYYFLWRADLESFDLAYLLNHLMHYLRNTVFDMENCKASSIHAYLENLDHYVPLDFFLEHRIGVCRHFALTAYCFLEKLQIEQLNLPFAIDLVSSTIEGKRHAWLLLFCKNCNRSFHFDPFWGIVTEKAPSDNYASETKPKSL